MKLRTWLAAAALLAVAGCTNESRGLSGFDNTPTPTGPAKRPPTEFVVPFEQMAVGHPANMSANGRYVVFWSGSGRMYVGATQVDCAATAVSPPWSDERAIDDFAWGEDAAGNPFLAIWQESLQPAWFLIDGEPPLLQPVGPDMDVKFGPRVGRDGGSIR